MAFFLAASIARVAFELLVLLGVHRVLQLGTNRCRDLIVQILIDLRRDLYSFFGLPHFFTSSRMPAAIFLQQSWPNSMAASTSASLACCAPDSTITMPSSVPATTMLTCDALVSS